MNSISEPLTKLIENCKNLSIHTRINRVCEFVEKDAEPLIQAIQQLEQENEQLKQRIAELEARE